MGARTGRTVGPHLVRRRRLGHGGQRDTDVLEGLAFQDLAGELVVLWASLFALATRDTLLSNARVQDDLERTERLINAKAGETPTRDLRIS